MVPVWRTQRAACFDVRHSRCLLAVLESSWRSLIDTPRCVGTTNKGWAELTPVALSFTPTQAMVLLTMVGMIGPLYPSVALAGAIAFAGRWLVAYVLAHAAVRAGTMHAWQVQGARGVPFATMAASLLLMCAGQFMFFRFGMVEGTFYANIGVALALEAVIGLAIVKLRDRCLSRRANNKAHRHRGGGSNASSASSLSSLSAASGLLSQGVSSVQQQQQQGGK